MTRPFDAYVLNEQTPTSTGIQTYTVSGVGGTPVGAIVQVVRVSSLDTSTSGVSYCYGVADGTNEHSVTNRAKDSVTTVESRVQRSDTQVIRLVAADGTLSIVATVDSFITDGIKLNFTTVEGSQFRMSITLIFGSETEGFAFHSAAPTSGSPVTITPGFATDVVFTHDARSSGTAAERNTRAYFGIAARGETKPNVFAGMSSQDNISTSITKRISSGAKLNVDVGFPVTNINAGFVTIGTYTSTTFDVIYGSGMTTSARGLIGLALKLPASHGYTLDATVAFPASTGSKTHTTSFKPALIYSSNSANVSADQDMTSGAVAVGVCDWRLEQSCAAFAEQNNVSTTNTSSAFSHDFHYLMVHTGVLKQQAEVTDHDATSFTFNVTAAVDGRHWSVLTIEELPFTVAATGAIPAPSISATVDQGFTAAITGTLPAPSIDAVVDQGFTAAITGTLPAPSIDAAIDQGHTISVSGALPAPTITAAVSQGFTAAITGTLPAPSIASIVDQGFSLAITGTLPAPSIASIVDQGFSLAITGTLPAPSIAATINNGTEILIVISGLLPAPLVAAAINQGFSLAVAGALPAPSISASLTNGQELGCEIALLGDYALSTGLLGDHLSAMGLTADYLSSTALSADHASSTALLGDQNATTSLDGSIC